MKYRLTKCLLYDINEWSPKVAARNILQLISDLQDGKDASITEGPCSKALPIK